MKYEEITPNIKNIIKALIRRQKRCRNCQLHDSHFEAFFIFFKYVLNTLQQRRLVLLINVIVRLNILTNYD